MQTSVLRTVSEYPNLPRVALPDTKQNIPNPDAKITLLQSDSTRGHEGLCDDITVELYNPDVVVSQFVTISYEF